MNYSLLEDSNSLSRSGVISQLNWWDHSSWDWLSCVTLLINAIGMSQFGFTRDILLREGLTWSREQTRDSPTSTWLSSTHQPTHGSPTNTWLANTLSILLYQRRPAPFQPTSLFATNTWLSRTARDQKHWQNDTWPAALDFKRLVGNSRPPELTSLRIPVFFFFFFFSKISKTAPRLNTLPDFNRLTDATLSLSRKLLCCGACDYQVMSNRLTCLFDSTLKHSDCSRMIPKETKQGNSECSTSVLPVAVTLIRIWGFYPLILFPLVIRPPLHLSSTFLTQNPVESFRKPLPPLRRLSQTTFRSLRSNRCTLSSLLSWKLPDRFTKARIWSL